MGSASSPDAPAPARRLALAALRVLPKSALSHLAGRVASLRLPRPLARLVVVSFGRAVGVDFGEVRDPIASFRSLQDFFTRALAPGARPVDDAPDAFVAPCDGAFGASGRIEQGRLLQVKGRPYSLAELLGDEADARRFEGGSFVTLYLSPRDYHRFHAPCALRVTRLRRLPGALWPVNRLGVEGIEALFARNERLCAFFARPGNAGEPLCIVAVGATIVGKVRVTFDDLRTHERPAEVVEHRYGDAGPRLAKGEEWGRFEFGSTLVVVAAAGAVTPAPGPPGTPVRLGTRIGTLPASGGA
ncbi:MAG TPA: archaetidylserine decarboxylase [Myxococcota bacterium]|jgi:phosphatidylserine decarboxylase|nr:archaetidylserine decarboxylase [Myxococcota bacterium]